MIGEELDFDAIANSSWHEFEDDTLELSTGSGPSSVLQYNFTVINRIDGHPVGNSLLCGLKRHGCRILDLETGQVAARYLGHGGRLISISRGVRRAFIPPTFLLSHSDRPIQTSSYPVQ